MLQIFALFTWSGRDFKRRYLFRLITQPFRQLSAKKRLVFLFILKRRYLRLG